MIKYPKDKRDAKREKRKQMRYNRICSIIIACKLQNSEMLAYLLSLDKEQIPV
jgi:hypothetical protein